jgi:uncharacterized protein (DUF488 family)
MAPSDAAGQPCLFTVGHSNHTPEKFLDLLRQHNIEVIVDSRSAPYSRYVPQFNKAALQVLVQQAGLKYLFLGKELGGRPEGAEFYDAEGYVLYFRVAESAPFREGVARLEKGIRQYRVALLCSEEDPFVCHRRLLVSRVLAQRGVTICHIRGDGTLQTDVALQEGIPQQGSLFDFPEDHAWKSLRPIAPKLPQPPSSQPLPD